MPRTLRVQPTDHLFPVDATNYDIDIYLPSYTAVPNRPFWFDAVDATNTITIYPSDHAIDAGAGVTVEGGASVTLTGPKGLYYHAPTRNWRALV